MGTTWAVMAAQEVAEMFCRRLTEECKARGIQISECQIVYIDNLYLFCDDHTSALAVQAVAMELATRWDAKLTSCVSRTPSILGMQCNLKTQSIQLADKYYKKHAEAWDEEVEDKCNAAKLIRWLGVFIRAAYMLRVPLYSLRGTLMLLAKVARIAHAEEYKLDDLWIQMDSGDKSAITKVRELTKCGTEAHVKGPIVDYERLVYCDAAEWGYGYIAIDDIDTLVASVPWEGPCPKDQATREAMGACRAIEELHTQENSKPTLLLVDASVVVHGEKKGWSKNYYINRCAELCDKHGVRVVHIPGEENLADGVSRGKSPPTALAVANSLQHVTNHVSGKINHHARSTW